MESRGAKKARSEKMCRLNNLFSLRLRLRAEENSSSHANRSHQGTSFALIPWLARGLERKRFAMI
jgi:hypothetical protein